MRHQLFGSASAPARRRLLRVAALAAAAGLVLAAAGCTSSGPSETAASSSSSAAGTFAGAPAADGPSAAAGGSSASSAAPAAGAGAASGASGASGAAGGKGAGVDVAAGVQAADRQVIRTAAVSLEIAVPTTGKGDDRDAVAEANAVAKASAQIEALATGQGYVSAEDGKGTTMSITLQVPAGSYSSIMTAIAGIGRVTSTHATTDDVTSQMVDLTSRMETMKASVDRVRTLLSSATKIGDVISIESELSSREADLESLQRQQAALAGQTSLSTITVVLSGSITGVKEVIAPPPPAVQSGFVGGLISGWHGFRHVGHAVLTVVGTLIPFLPLILVVAIGALIWRRRLRRAAGVPTLAATPGDPHPAD